VGRTWGSVPGGIELYPVHTQFEGGGSLGGRVSDFLPTRFHRGVTERYDPSSSRAGRRRVAGAPAPDRSAARSAGSPGEDGPFLVATAGPHGRGRELYPLHTQLRGGAFWPEPFGGAVPLRGQGTAAR
jgi:hypothetical protein